MRMLRLLKLIIFSVVLIPLCTHAAPTIVLNITNDIYEIGRSTEYYPDHNGKHTIKDILTPEIQKKFIPSRKKTLNFGFTDAVYWIRFRVKNNASMDRKWIIKQSYPMIDTLELYAVDNGKSALLSRGGRAMPFHTRELKHRTLTFPLQMKTGQERTFYIKFRSSSNMSIGLSIREITSFIKTDSDSHLRLGIFIGIMLIIIVYNILLYFSLRDSTYLYYILFIISIGLTLTGLNGLTYKYLWPNLPWWNIYSFIFFTSLTCGSLLMFSKKFLDTAANAPFWNRVINIPLFVFILNGLSAFFVPYSVNVKILSIMAVCSSIILFITGLRCLMQGYRAARFYMIAWSVFLISAFILGMRNLGVLPHSFLTANAMHFGTTFLIAFLSLALGDKIKIFRKEHDRLDTIERELNIAREVQSNILTTPSLYKTIPGLDMDVAFIPMNRTVSGDYYNINKPEGKKASLLIADASGHGMQAALTTMQIDLHWKESQVYHSPQERLDNMNRRWTKNNLDNSFFTCFSMDIYDGHIVYASAGHITQLLIRPETREVIELQAPGQLIGFSGDTQFRQNEQDIRKGDFLFLYTDGTTEEFNGKGEEFGEQRLVDLLSVYLFEKRPNISSRMINHLIYNGLSSFRQEQPINDDITMISIIVQ